MAATKGVSRDEYVEAYGRLGTASAVARELGVTRQTASEALRRAGVLRPTVAPLREPADGRLIGRTTTLIKNPPEVVAQTGVVMQWMRDAPEAGALEAFSDAVRRLCDPLEGLGPVSAVPVVSPEADDLAVVVPIGDPHIGMLSWAAETGDDWDLREAERVFVSAGRRAVAVAPEAGRFILINLGDYFHSDDQSNQTRRSGHQLDVDSRWARVIEVGIRIQVRMIEAALEKFPSVEIINVRGNHDEHSSIMLAQVMGAWWRNEPRVIVHQSPSLHQYVAHGESLIATHHGHTANKAQLAMMWAAHPAWQGKRHRRVYCGHWHRDSLHEFPGVIVEHVNTLAARDAYAAGAGYISGRDLKVDTWHKRDGMTNRAILGIDTIRRGA